MIGDLQITKEYNDYSQDLESTGNRRPVEHCLCAEACKQMQGGRGNKLALLFPVLKCEILSIVDSLNQYKHKGSFIPPISHYNFQDRNSRFSGYICYNNWSRKSCWFIDTKLCYLRKQWGKVTSVSQIQKS